ncbi:MAG: DUF2231 domain-containing protein [Bacteroidota bacterium]
MDLPLHPFFVHFPVALLLVSGLAYITAIFQERAFYQRAGFLLHVAGILGSIAAIFTGRGAEAEIVHTEAIHQLVELHEKLAYVMVWVLIMLLLWQYLRGAKQTKMEMGIFALVFVANMGLMLFSSHLGGEMVYKEGAGIYPMEPALKAQFQQEQEEKYPQEKQEVMQE